jgi:O-antigen ligase
LITSSFRFTDQETVSGYPKLTLLVFFLVQLLFAGYALRGNVPYNFEIVFAPLLMILGYLIAKPASGVKDRRLLLWVGLIFLYCATVFLMSVYHAPLGEVGWHNIRITGLMFGFLVLLLVLYELRPTIDFFWTFFLGASVAMLIWFGMELNHWGVDGLMQGQRFGSAYGHPIKFGIYANGLFIIMLGGIVWAYRKGPLILAFWVFLIVTNLLIVIFSQTRTAWIGWPEALVGWGLFYLFMLLKSALSFKQKTLLLVFPALFVSVLLSTDSVYKVFEKRVNLAITDTQQYVSGTNPFTSLGLRYLMYEASYELIKERPVSGYGADAFAENLKSKTSYLLKEKFAKKHPGLHFTQIHNQFLMSWLNYGVFAVLALLLIFVFLFWHFFTGMRSASMDEKPIWIAGLVFSVASFMSFMPESPLQYSSYSSHFFLMMTLCWDSVCW